MKRFAERQAVLLKSLRRPDPIRRSVEVDLRPLLIFHLRNPRRSKTKLGSGDVPFEPWLKVRRRLIVERHTVARAQLHCVRKAISDHPLFVEAPRTEELAFAGSPGSRRDGNLRIRKPHEGKHEDGENSTSQLLIHPSFLVLENGGPAGIRTRDQAVMSRTL